MVRKDVLREVNRPATNSEKVRKTRSQTQNLNLKKIEENKKCSIPIKAKENKRNCEKKNITKAKEVYSVRTTRSTQKVAEEKNAAKTDDIQSNSVRITRSKSNIASVKKIESISYNLPHAKSNEKNIVVERVDFIKLNEFKENSVVLAKQKYSQPWPARVVKITKKKVLVYFFGDRREGCVDSQEIYDFRKSAEALKLVLKSKQKKCDGYLAGIREIEMLLEISYEESLLNAI